MTEKVNRHTSTPLVEEMRNRSSLLAAQPKTDAETAVSRVFDALKTMTDRGEAVRISGFGTFRLKHRAGRAARNPRTGETIQTAAKDVLVFKPSKGS